MADLWWSILALVIAAACLGAGIAIVYLGWKSSTETLDSVGEPCPRCGKKVLPGAEVYHMKRCSGRQEQRSYKFGRGERIDR